MASEGQREQTKRITFSAEFSAPIEYILRKSLSQRDIWT